MLVLFIFIFTPLSLKAKNGNSSDLFFNYHYSLIILFQPKYASQNNSLLTSKCQHHYLKLLSLLLHLFLQTLQPTKKKTLKIPSTLNFNIFKQWAKLRAVTMWTHTFSPSAATNKTALPCLCKEAITISRVSSSNFLQRVLSTFHGMMWSVVSHSTQL